MSGLKKTGRKHIDRVAAVIKDVMGGELDFDEMFKQLISGITPMQIVDIPKESMENLYRISHAEYQNGAYKEAMSGFAMLTMIDSTQSSYLAGLAACMYMLKQYPQAIEIYGLLIALYGKVGLNAFYMAQCLVEVNRIEEAKKMLHHAEKTHAFVDKELTALNLLKSKLGLVQVPAQLTGE